jgi:hypothetical protein
MNPLKFFESWQEQYHREEHEHAMRNHAIAELCIARQRAGCRVKLVIEPGYDYRIEPVEM